MFGVAITHIIDLEMFQVLDITVVRDDQGHELAACGPVIGGVRSGTVSGEVDKDGISWAEVTWMCAPASTEHLDVLHYLRPASFVIAQ